VSENAHSRDWIAAYRREISTEDFSSVLVDDDRIDEIRTPMFIRIENKRIDGMLNGKGKREGDILTCIP
jgi:hypothetical protein